MPHIPKNPVITGQAGVAHHSAQRGSYGGVQHVLLSVVVAGTGKHSSKAFAASPEHGKHTQLMGWYGRVRYDVVWYAMVWYGMVGRGVVWCGMVWYGVVWHGMVW